MEPFNRYLKNNDKNISFLQRESIKENYQIFDKNNLQNIFMIFA